MMNRTYLSAMLLVVSVAAFAGENQAPVEQPSRITRAVATLTTPTAKVVGSTVATAALVGGGYAARNTRPVQATVLRTKLVGNGIASGFNYVVSTRPVQATVSCVRQAGSYVVSKCPTVSRPTVEGTKAIASKVLSTVKNNKQRTAIGASLTIATACAAREVYNYRNNGGTATAAGLRYIGNSLQSGWNFVRGNKNINAAPIAEQEEGIVQVALRIDKRTMAPRFVILPTTASDGYILVPFVGMEAKIADATSGSVTLLNNVQLYLVPNEINETQSDLVVFDESSEQGIIFRAETIEAMTAEEIAAMMEAVNAFINSTSVTEILV